MNADLKIRMQISKNERKKTINALTYSLIIKLHLQCAESVPREMDTHDRIDKLENERYRERWHDARQIKRFSYVNGYNLTGLEKWAHVRIATEGACQRNKQKHTNNSAIAAQQNVQTFTAAHTHTHTNLNSWLNDAKYWSKI